MIPITKEELIEQYIDYRINSYKVGFTDNLKLDRVEKILDCHGWLQEAEKAFKGTEKAIEEKRDLLKGKIVEALKDCDIFITFRIEESLEPLKEEIRNIDRRGHIRIWAAEELFKQRELNFIDKAIVLMKLGEIGL